MTAMRSRHARAAALLALALMLCGAHAADPFDIEPAKPPRVLNPSYFGTHFHRLGHAERNFAATAWPASPIGALRLWDSRTRWADLEPAPGRFRFDRLDAHVALAQAHGAPILLVLGSPARWASARPDEAGPYGPGSAAEPRSFDDWERYVGAVARRYKGRIAQYELWNEPYFSDLPRDRGHAGAFFTGSVATMVELARRTRAVLEREDPRAGLLTPGFVGAPHRLDMFLAAGGGRYVDAVAYHFYADDDRGLLELHAEVRAVMAKHGLARAPLYNTESGFALADRRQAAALLARAMLLSAFAGVDRFYQYAWDNGRMGMLLEDGRTTTPSLAAFESVRRWLAGTTLRGCRMQPAQVVRCEGERDGARVFIAWRAVGVGSAELVLPPELDPVSAEHAIDGGLPVDTGVRRTRAMPVGAVPVAVWMRAHPSGLR